MKITKLRELMKKNGMDAYIIVTDDFHGSEYVGDYFKVREYMSGFTGSAGTLVVLPDWSGLWTDGRYFLQAEKELEGSDIELMKAGEPGVLSISDFLYEKLADNAVIGFDGRTISCSFADRLADKLNNKKIKFAFNNDLSDYIWKNRPGISKMPVWELPVRYAGMSRRDKIAKLRRKIGDIDYFIVTALDEIAWLLNLRGGDVDCTPVFLAFMIVGREDIRLFLHKEVLDDTIKDTLKNDGVSIGAYDEIYSALSEIEDGAHVLIDSDTANYMIRESINKDAVISVAESPIVLMKAVKNPAEMDNIKMAHIKDGVAVTRFIHWMKQEVKEGGVTELSAAAKLEEYRRAMEGYLGPSFTPIIGYGEHGAIVHYDPTVETDMELKPVGLCLADTGGHYMEGTTDITRTIPLGPLTDEEKKAYTLVMKGHLNLANAWFKYGLTGANLDYLARSPLWEYGMDYNHGTGHGVGYILSVHEGPQRIHWKVGDKNIVLEEGMVISDEPGYYEPGKFGIRHENLVMVRQGKKTEYGQFMYFDNLTMVPFDKEGIDKKYMTDKEIEWFNRYQKMVYNNICEYFEGEELEWLKEYTNFL